MYNTVAHAVRLTLASSDALIKVTGATSSSVLVCPASEVDEKLTCSRAYLTFSHDGNETTASHPSFSQDSRSLHTGDEHKRTSKY